MYWSEINSGVVVELFPELVSKVVAKSVVEKVYSHSLKFGNSRFWQIHGLDLNFVENLAFEPIWWTELIIDSMHLREASKSSSVEWSKTSIIVW